MKDFDRIRAVKDSARARILAIPGIHGIAIGAKVVAGTPTAELAIAVFLVKKRPILEVPHEYLVPPYIDGFKTDVIEMEVPRQTDVGAPTYPTTLDVKRSGPTTIALAGSDVPGAGFVVVVGMTAGSGGATNQYNISLYTNTGDSLFQIASNLAAKIQTITGVPATPDVDGSQIVLAPQAGTNGSVISCAVWITDSTSYNPLVGGVEIQGVPVNMHGTGTLGCMLVDSNAPAQVYGLTNYHVVALWGHTYSRNALILSALVSTSQPQPGQAIDINFLTIGTGNLPITITTLTIAIDTGTPFEIISVYTPSSPPSATDVADAISAIQTEINNQLSSIVSAGINGRVITISPTNTASKVTVTAHCNNGDIATLNQDFLSNLSATVNGTNITFSGNVNGDNYGIYTVFHIGGSVPTYGVFTSAKNGDSLDDVAKGVALSISQLTADIKNKYNKDVSATPNGANVAVGGVKIIECNVNHDVRASQPGGVPGLFAPVSGPGLRGKIGKVTAARFDVDAAIIQLSEGLQYGAQVSNVSGNLAGSVSATVGQLVKKRGCSSNVTTGTITHIAFDGLSQSGGSPPRFFLGAIRVVSATSAPFILPGDSGSVLLDNSNGPDNNKVVGLLFAGTVDDHTVAMATPIDQVTQAFLPLFVQVATSDGTVPAAVSQ